MKEPTRRSQIFLGPAEASLVNRVSAKLIDLVVTLVIYFVGCVFFSWLGIIAAIVFTAVQDSFGVGQSVGKRMMGLQVVEEPHRTACSVQASVVRNSPFILLFLFGLLPALRLFAVALALPIVALELYLLWNVESGVRLGDVLANTTVKEYDSSR